MKNELLLLKELTEAKGISGNEKEVRNIMKREMEQLNVEISYDNIGSIIAKKVGDEAGPRVMISGHMDEIGLMVTKITDDGFLKFQTIGGWWSQVMLAQQFDVVTKDGNIYRAVMGSKPPHLLKEEERKNPVKVEDLFLDIGVKNKEEVEKIGIRIGDMVTPVLDFQVMANPDYLLAKAFDDRIGCAVVLEVLKNLNKEHHPNILFGVGTVQEEVGLRGAKTAAYICNPEIAIAVDVGIAQDTPGLNGNAKMGEGPLLLIYDGGLVGHKELREFVIRVAEENKIPYQYDYLSRGGTDAGQMHLAKNGSPALSLCIASRYIHSHTSMISHKDYQNTVKLLTALIKRLNREEVNKITFI